MSGLGLFLGAVLATLLPLLLLPIIGRLQRTPEGTGSSEAAPVEGSQRLESAPWVHEALLGSVDATVDRLQSHLVTHSVYKDYEIWVKHEKVIRELLEEEFEARLSSRAKLVKAMTSAERAIIKRYIYSPRRRKTLASVRSRDLIRKWMRLTNRSVQSKRLDSVLRDVLHDLPEVTENEMAALFETPAEETSRRLADRGSTADKKILTGPKSHSSK